MVPVITAAAVALASSAQTYPTSNETSMTPSCAFIAGSWPHRRFAGSYSVLLRSPGMRTGMGAQTSVGRMPSSRQRTSMSHARLWVSSRSMCGAVRKADIMSRLSMTRRLRLPWRS